MCSALVATSFYYVMNGLVEEQLPEGGARRELFSLVNLLQNLGSLVIQVWVTRTALLRLGIAAVLCIMPLVSLLGLSLAAVLPVVGVMAGFEVLRRMMQFAFDKPGREVLFTPLDREAKYKSKAFIDTVVLRSGDLLGAFLNDALVERGFGYRALALGSAPLVVGWAWLGSWLGRACQRQERQPKG